MTASLASLQPELLAAALEPTARGMLAVLMVVGILLVLAGARLLRPAVVAAAMAVGFLGAIVTARALLPGVPLWAAAAVGAVAGLLAGSLLYRPVVAVAAAAVGSAVGALVAFAVMAGGALDTAPRDLGHALVENPREVRRDGDGQRAGMRILAVLAPDAVAAPETGPHGAADAALSNAADAALPVGERALRSAVDITHRAGDRAADAYRGTAPAYRTLLTASTAAGAIAGLLAGFLATGLVARMLTSFAGAWLLLGGALPLLALRGLEPMPADARTWLVVLAAIAFAGTLAQGALCAGTPRAAKPRARRAAERGPSASQAAAAD